MNMMKNHEAVIEQGQASLLSTHVVLRNTYLLLSMTLLFSALTAWFGMATGAQPMGMLLSLVGTFGLLFLTMALRNSVWGLVSVFGFTGFIGYMVGPVVGMVINSYSNGSSIVFSTLATTGAVFLGLSAYAITTRKTFSYLSGFLFAGLIILIVGSLVNMFLKMPALYMAISFAGAFIASGLILVDTARIIHNGERNYIMATISLYLDIYMLFMNLLSILTSLSGRNN
jgi:modulator of FtsH protease